MHFNPCLNAPQGFMLIPTPASQGSLRSKFQSLNAPQGFMLIPTTHTHRNYMPTQTVLMPLRASCSFQLNSYLGIIDSTKS